MKAKGAKSQKPRPEPAGLDKLPFLATVMRHELYGTLNAITMVAGLLGERGRKGAVDGEELQKLSARLLRQIERATAIVDHYVELIGPGDEEEVAEASCGAAEIKRALEGTGARLELAGLPADAELSMEAGRLRFALERVVGYAARKMPPGQQVTVALSNEEEDFVTLEIRYTGDALGSDDLHVFERGPGGVEPELIDLAVARRVLTDAGGEVAPRAGQIIIRLPRLLD